MNFRALYIASVASLWACNNEVKASGNGDASVVTTDAAVAKAATADAAVTEPVKIGVTLQLGGSSAVKGMARQQSIDLAIREINEAGGVAGRQLELVAKDNAGDTVMATNTVQEFLNAHNVAAV